MKRADEAIIIGINEYYEVYTQAVNQLWERNKTVTGIPIEHWLIAQCVQESRFDRFATSPVGANGIAQFMQTTAQQVAHELKHIDLFKDGFDTENTTQSIFAQVYYMNKMFDTWSWKRTDASRMTLALASYNAGAGHISEAQQKSGNKAHWFLIKHYLNDVTGEHSKETINYVEKITEYAIIVCDYKI
jgi:membrane-bound lytic murein transglycosylase MltF